MVCHRCGSEEKTTMFEESFECDCGKTNTIGVHMCTNCGIMWRSYNGQVLESSEIHIDDFLQGVSMPYTMSEEEAEVLKNMEEELLKVDRIKTGNAKSMSDYIHNCLKCGAIAHETRPGIYKCAECGFEWEVVSFE